MHAPLMMMTVGGQKWKALFSLDVCRLWKMIFVFQLKLIRRLHDDWVIICQNIVCRGSAIALLGRRRFARRRR